MAISRTPIPTGTSVSILNSERKIRAVGIVVGYAKVNGRYLVDYIMNQKVIREKIARGQLTKRKHQAATEANPSLRWLRENANGFTFKPLQQIQAPEKIKQNQSGYCKNCGVTLVGEEGKCPGCGQELQYIAQAPAYSAIPPVFSAKPPENKPLLTRYRLEMSCSRCQIRRVAVIDAENADAAREILNYAIDQRNREKNHKHYTSRDLEPAPLGAQLSDWKKVDY